MRSLLAKINGLKRSKVRREVDRRILEFDKNGRKSSLEIFKELSFCILTANFNAERAIRIQEDLGDGFLTLSQPRLAEKLRKLGHRYPNARAAYIVEARKHANSIKKILRSYRGIELRDWFVENVRGLGFKEASHFLRNIGYRDYAIIDFHILDVLEEYSLIKKPKTLTKRKYLEIEDCLRKMAGKLNINLAELDLYLWYMETGKILK